MGRTFLEAATPSGSNAHHPCMSWIHHPKEALRTTVSRAFMTPVWLQRITRARLAIMTPKGSQPVTRPAQQASDPEGVAAGVRHQRRPSGSYREMPEPTKPHDHGQDHEPADILPDACDPFGVERASLLDDLDP
jgi:hypothetical protein